MKLRRRRVADFHTLQCDDTGQTDTCELEDEEIYPQYPEQDGLALTGRDFQRAEAAIEPSTESKGFFFMYRWGHEFTDGDLTALSMFGAMAGYLSLSGASTMAMEKLRMSPTLHCLQPRF